MLTVHLLAQNDQNIRKTLDSLPDLPILVGYTNTLDFQDDRCKVIKVSGTRDVARNKMSEASNTEWQLYLEPGEVLAKGHELLYDIDSAKKVYVVSDDLITKEIRIWKKGMQFVNPVFENLQVEATPINVFINAATSMNNLADLLEWQKQKPHISEIDYYLACQYLMLKDYQKFLTHADYFLFKETQDTYSKIMMHYYLAQYHLHIKKDSHETIRNLIYCLSQKPLLAEFWCVLGDCYYRARDMLKALAFFQIAKEMGKHRDTGDSYPIELSKYNDYPDKMIELCRLKRAHQYHSQSQ